RAVNLVPELDAESAANEQPEHHHERQVEATERSRVEDWEGKVERPPGCQEPDLVPIPDRPDGANHRPALRLRPGHKEGQDTGAEIEAVEYDVHQDHEKDEQKPDRCHGYAPSGSGP